MADKKDTIGGLSDAVETLNKDNATSGIESNQILGNIESGIQDLYAVNSQMLEAISAIQASLAPDAFGSAQSTETSREADGAPIIGGPAEQSVVTPTEGKKGMGMMGMLGVAAAGAAAGLVAAFAGFLDFDAQKVKDKVLILTSIADEVDGADTAETVATLASLGVGLAAFGIGSIANGIGQSFMEDNWADKIYDSVATLIKIGDLSFLSAVEAAGSLTTLGIGLAAFGIGSGVGALGAGLAEGMLKEGWADKIYDSVATLISIGDLSFLGAVEAAGSLTTLGAGLAVFGIGSAVGGAGQAIADTMSDANWAQRIYDSVETLIGIGDLSFFAAVEAAGSLTTLGAGLAVFGVGSAVASLAKPGFADGIVDSVETLTSVKDKITAEEAETFNDTMGSLSAGLLKFSGSNFLGSIMDAGTALMGFLSGNESPIEQMITIADKSEELNKGADAIDRVRLAISKLSSISFDGAGFNIKDLTDDLMNSIPALELAIQGGTVGEGFFSSGTEIKGLASPDIDYEAAVARIQSLREALGGASASVSSSVAQTAVPADTGAGITGSTDTTIVDTGDLTLPYNSREKKLRAKQLAKALGMGTARTATFEAGIPTTVDGVEVPTYLYTNDEIDRINGARTMRAEMNNTSANLIPTRQSGQDLQQAQAEANANSRSSEPPTVIQSNVSPSTVNNQSTTNLASRTQHHTSAKNELMLGAF